MMRHLFVLTILLFYGIIDVLAQTESEKDSIAKAKKEELHRAEQCEFHRKISASKFFHSDYAYVKGFKLCGTKCEDCKVKKGIYRLVLESGNEYSLKISNWRGDTYAVLYDDKGNRIGKSMYKGKVYDGFTFICKSTGIYYLRFFDQHKRPAGETLIGGASLGMKRWKY